MAYTLPPNPPVGTQVTLANNTVLEFQGQVNGEDVWDVVPSLAAINTTNVNVLDEGNFVATVDTLNFIGDDAQAVHNVPLDRVDIYIPTVTFTGSGGVTSPASKPILGTTVNNVTIDWSYTPDLVDSQSFTGPGAVPLVPADRTVNLAGLGLTGTETWNFTGNHPVFGVTMFAVTLEFANRIHYGKSPLASLSDTEIQALSDAVVSNNPYRNYVTGTNGVPEYFYICYPDRIPDITRWEDANGIEVPFTTLAPVSVTNPEGFTEDYIVQRSVNQFTGNLTITAS